VDGDVDIEDWSALLAGAYTDLSGLSPAESYGHGDLDGDGDSDFADFRLFKSDFDAANGVGAFEAMSNGVPEPASSKLIFVAAAIATSAIRRRRALHKNLCRSGLRPRFRIATSQRVAMWRVIGVGDASYIRDLPDMF
jgi:hypothetical protein